jgi:glutathione S-transferase
MRWTHSAGAAKVPSMTTRQELKLYFSPLACSLASRITIYEAGAPAIFIEVDGKTKRTSDDRDFRTIHELGLVPALELPSGEVLVENAAVLQQLARSFPAARLAPTSNEQLAKLQQYLCFIGTELHKSIYVPLLDEHAPEGAKRYALSKAESRLRWLDAALTGRSYLLDELSVADAYLFAVLNWSTVTPIELTPYPGIAAFMARMHARPCVARAFAEELSLYRAEQARRQTA